MNNMKKLSADNFFIKADIFLDTLSTNLQGIGFDGGHYSIDHICYRVESEEEYLIVKNDLLEFSTLLIESEVGGRLISTFKLNKPITYKGFVIDLVELPAPKKSKIVKSGLEHIEIVTMKSFEDLILTNPRLSFDGLSLLNKDYNQELKLDVGGDQVKFHYQSLESVINLELNHNLYQTIIELGVLSELKQYFPLVASSHCLGVDVGAESINILLRFSNIHEFKGLINKLYGGSIDFSDELLDVDSTLTYTAKFMFKDIEFKLIAQDKHPIYQNLQIAFNIEERLLKVGGLKLKDLVIKHKKSGDDTELSFTKALSMTGEPLAELKKLSTLTEIELKKFIEDRIK